MCLNKVIALSFHCHCHYDDVRKTFFQLLTINLALKQNHQQFCAQPW